MAKKLKLEELEMDSIEILYYERQAARKRAYEAKRRKKCDMKNRKFHIEQSTKTFDIIPKQAI